MLLSTIVVLLVLLLLGLLALAGVCFLYLSVGETILISIPQMFFASTASYPLLAIPFFLLASALVQLGIMGSPAHWGVTIAVLLTMVFPPLALRLPSLVK